jgi:hypothetical protein
MARGYIEIVRDSGNESIWRRMNRLGYRYIPVPAGSLIVSPELVAPAQINLSRHHVRMQMVLP